jgi:hypothetical protein
MKESMGLNVILIVLALTLVIFGVWWILRVSTRSAA